MVRFRRLVAAAMGMAMALALAACGGGGAGAQSGSSTGGGAPPGSLIGVSMPTKTDQRWIADGANVKAGLEAAGYKVDLEYANNDIPTQAQQLDQMITKGVKLLIIASIDGTALSAQLNSAAGAKIPVISYDRLLTGNKNVTFYVTFDNYKTGVQQGTSLLTGLGLLKADSSKGAAKGPFNIELFAGSQNDNNTQFFWKGAMDTLQPYINSKTLVVRSGQKTMGQTAILNWDQETAQKRMDDLLTGSYTGGPKIAGVLSPYDGISRGVITSLQNGGYSGTVSTGFPIVTGQDAEIASAKMIANDVQYSTIFKDTRKLAAEAVTAAKALLSGQTPVANDTKSYNNGVKVVPAFLLPSVIVTKDNLQKVIIDSGYYTSDQVRKGVL
jgi:putative multiple sugar transport system substrate-binding protein